MNSPANPPKPVPLATVRDLRGPKADVVTKIEAMPLPDHRKAYLIAEVNLCEGSGVVIDGAFADEPANRVQHLHVKKLY